MAALRNSNRTTLTRGRSLIGPAALTILAALFIVAVQTVVAETAGRFLGALPIASAAESANVTPLGRGKMKRLVIQPKVVTFNRIPARMSETVTVTVGNPNSVAAQITSIRPHGLDFKVASNECTSPLAPAASCTLTVAFSPRTPGRKT